MSKLLALLAVLLVGANAISISWTGYAGDNQWTNRVNWSPDQVPSTGDDVTFTQGVILVTIPTGVNSLVMGTSFNGPANLTIFQTFFIGSGGMQVEGNGNLFVNAGSAAITGQVTIGGNLFFQSGSISGQWQITNRGVANLGGMAQKVFTGCQFMSQALSFTFGGVMTMNQSSQVVVQSGSSVIMSGPVSIQAGDSSAVLLDTSAGVFTYQGNGDLQIQAPVNIGTFNFMGGNLTIYDTISFANPFMIPSGSYVSTVGTAVANMSLGVSGPGVLTAAGSTLLLGNTTVTGAVNVVGGNVTFGAAGSNIAILTLSGGFAIVNYPVAATQLNFISGNLIGTSTITASQLLSNNQGFNVDIPVVVSTQASLGGLVSFGNSGGLTITSTATINVLATLVFTGVTGRTVTNNGGITVSSPVTFQNINLGGSGTVTASSTLSIQTAVVTQSTVTLSAAGVFKGANTQITSISAVKAPMNVHAVIGSYTFTCPKECDNLSTGGQIPTSSFHFSA